MMAQKLSQIQAEFLQRFRFKGNFETNRVDANDRRSRTTYKIVASDSKTTAALKREPDWLRKFV